MPIEVSKSAKIYQARKLFKDANALPAGTMRYDISQNPAHSMTLLPPLPLCEVVIANTNHLPDGGATELWPHGELTIL